MTSALVVFLMADLGSMKWNFVVRVLNIPHYWDASNIFQHTPVVTLAKWLNARLKRVGSQKYFPIIQSHCWNYISSLTIWFFFSSLDLSNVEYSNWAAESQFRERAMTQRRRFASFFASLVWQPQQIGKSRIDIWRVKFSSISPL